MSRSRLRSFEAATLCALGKFADTFSANRLEMHQFPWWNDFITVENLSSYCVSTYYVFAICFIISYPCIRTIVVLSINNLCHKSNLFALIISRRTKRYKIQSTTYRSIAHMQLLCMYFEWFPCL